MFSYLGWGEPPCFFIVRVYHHPKETTSFFLKWFTSRDAIVATEVRSVFPIFKNGACNPGGCVASWVAG